jgi:hypothetical protein
VQFSCTRLVLIDITAFYTYMKASISDSLFLGITFSGGRHWCASINALQMASPRPRPGWAEFRYPIEFVEESAEVFRGDTNAKITFGDIDSRL